MTSCNILSSHPDKSTLNIVVLPLAKEILNNTNDVPVMFESELKPFLAELSEKHGIEFDLSLFE
jgi:hypothetical protein